MSSVASQRDRLEARRFDALQRSFASQNRCSLHLEQAAVVPVSDRPASGLKCPPEVANQDTTAGFPDVEALESEDNGDVYQAPRRSNLPRKRPAETSSGDNESESNASGNEEAKATNQVPPNSEILLDTTVKHTRTGT